MGQWTLVVQGIGPHHNPSNPSSDADKMASDFVNLLKSKGQLISVANFTYSGREDLPKREDG